MLIASATPRCRRTDVLLRKEREEMGKKRLPSTPSAEPAVPGLSFATVNSAASGSVRKLIRTPELAKLLGVSARTLERLRIEGNGIPFTQITDRLVGYAPEDVEAWLAERKRKSTSAKSPR